MTTDANCNFRISLLIGNLRVRSPLHTLIPRHCHSSSLQILFCAKTVPYLALSHGGCMRTYALYNFESPPRESIFTVSGQVTPGPPPVSRWLIDFSSCSCLETRAPFLTVPILSVDACRLLLAEHSFARSTSETVHVVSCKHTSLHQYHKYLIIHLNQSSKIQKRNIKYPLIVVTSQYRNCMRNKNNLMWTDTYR